MKGYDLLKTSPDWGRSIQRVKGYDLRTEIGQDIWQKVSDALWLNRSLRVNLTLQEVTPIPYS